MIIAIRMTDAIAVTIPSHGKAALNSQSPNRTVSIGMTSNR